MLKKAWRLTKNEDFERVFRKGTPLFFGGVACKVAPNTLGHIRLGFSLGKKHLTTIVKRNRLRRVLVEPFSIHFSGTPETERRCSVDIVFFTVKRVAATESAGFASVAESVVKYISQ